MEGYNPQQQWQGSIALNHALPEPSPQASQLSADSLEEEPLSLVKRVAIACENCRTGRRKCSGNQPCHDCKTKFRTCVYRLASKAAAKTLDEDINVLKKVKPDLEEHKSWTEEYLQEVRESSKRTVQELTTRIEKSELIIERFMEYKNSSEQKIQKLEEANLWVLQHSLDHTNATLQWMGKLGKHIDDLERKVGDLKEKSFQRWREWIQRTARPENCVYQAVPNAAGLQGVTLEKSNEQTPEHVLYRDKLMLEWMEKVEKHAVDINKRLMDIEREGRETRRQVEELKVESYRRWQEQWSLAEGVPLTARPFMRH